MADRFARVGRISESRETFPAQLAVDYIEDMLAAAIAEKHAHLTYDSLPQIHTNKTRFTLLLQNLVANALKYSHPDIPPVIHIAARQEQGNWLFSVRDNGIGIKSDFYQQIFEPFKRLHSNDEFEGTGMGLAICRKIVGNLGGRIWLESIPGQGSIFFFTLPA